MQLFLTKFRPRRPGIYLTAYDPDQPRDESGRWGEGGPQEAPQDRDSWPDHIKALGVPPAWTNVQFSMDPKADLLVTGQDAAGRRQPIYSAEFKASQAEAKFNRVKELDREFDKVRQQNDDLRRQGGKTKEHAACLALIMSTGIRPGSESDTRAKKQAYGATTLQGQHVIQTPEGVRLQFTGKKGVALDIPVEDKKIAADLLSRAKHAGPTGQLFPNVSESSLLRHTHSLDGGGFKTKDFRTCLGTRQAMLAMKGVPKPKDEKSYKKQVKLVATAVSRKLGNTPTVALQSYINPCIFSAWRMSAHV